MFVYIPNFFIIDIFLLLIKNSRFRDFSLLLLRSNWKDKNPHRFAMLLFLSLIQELNKKSTTSIILQFLINS